MKIVYVVQYIEVEFGQRYEGYAVYLDKEECIKKTKERSESGAYSEGGGYYGPQRPLCYYEVPFKCLDKKDRKRIKSDGSSFTDKNWNPKFTSNAHYMDDK